MIRSIKIFKDYRALIIFLLQLMFFFIFILTSYFYAPLVLEVTTKIAEHAQDMYVDTFSFYLESIEYNYSMMINYLVAGSIIILLSWLVLNNLSWSLTHKINNPKANMKKMFFRFVISSLVYFIPVFLIITFLLFSEFNIVSYFVLALFTTIILFFMYITYSNIDETNYLDITSYLGSYKLLLLLLLLFFMWLAISFISFYQLYIFQNFWSLSLLIILHMWLRNFLIISLKRL